MDFKTGQRVQVIFPANVRPTKIAEVVTEEIPQDAGDSICEVRFVDNGAELWVPLSWVHPLLRTVGKRL